MMKWTIAILLTLSVAFSGDRPAEPKRDGWRSGGSMHAQAFEKLKKEKLEKLVDLATDGHANALFKENEGAEELPDDVTVLTIERTAHG